MKKAQLFTVFAAFLLIVFGFQNCSAPLPEEEGAAPVGTKSTSDINFAFNTRVDQVAYMSCPTLGSSYDKSTYFTFRVGAFNQGSGVGLDSKILSELAGMPTSAWKETIVSRPENLGAMPVLAIRNSLNAQSMAVNNTSPQSEVDYSRMLGVLTDDYIVDEILKNTSERVRYKRNGIIEGGRVEGHLNIGTDLSKHNDLQIKFSQGWLLAINYPIKTTAIDQIRAPAHYTSKLSPSTATTQVFGNGLRIGFKNLHTSATHATSWALSSVVEEDMEAPIGARPQSGFDCTNSLVFRIVRQGDVDAAATSTNSTKINCAMKADNPNALSASDQMLLKRARQSLRVEDWWIDWPNKCIVAKKYGSSVPHCYGSKPHPVQYDLSKQCNPDPLDSQATTHRCVALASICIR